MFCQFVKDEVRVPVEEKVGHLVVAFMFVDVCLALVSDT